jgi:RNA polymerase sigma factor (sigma-70 family)
MIVAMATSTTAASDGELLGAYRAGRDEGAFAEIVRRHVNLVYGTALRRVRDAHLAEDVTQAVFLVLAKKAPGLSRSVILAGWLYQTAQFLSADAMKSKIRREHHERAAGVLRETGAVDPWPAISPLLEEAMDGLTRRDRDLILVRYFEGWEIEAIARAAGASANTISKRLQRALERLRDRLAERGVGAPAAAVVSGCVKIASTASPDVAALAARAIGHSLFRMKAVAVICVALIGAAAGLWVLLMRPPPPVPLASVLPAKEFRRIAGPVDTTQPAELEQIRADIYVLRNYHIFVRDDEWIAAIARLAAAGRPAVPELVAELQRTNRDSTLRALARALRAIGDPRACPALIAAIVRCPAQSSDCGLDVRDPANIAFMNATALDADTMADRVSYGRAVREICATLKTITGHSIGRPWNIDAATTRPADLAHSARQHQRLMEQWQGWWTVHHREFVSDAEMATLSENPHPAEAVDAAGVALYGPAFASGGDYRLGPVHEEFLPAWDEAFDTTEVLDFDDERKITLLKLVLGTPPATGPSRIGDVNEVIGDAGVICEPQYRVYLPPPAGSRQTFSMQADPKSVYYWLQAQSQTIWPVDGSRWDTLEKEIAAGQSIVGSAGVTTFIYDENNTMLGGNFPRTFLFRTRLGNCGIVQLLDSDVQRRGVHLRYRMVEPCKRHNFIVPLLPAATFSEVRQITMEFRAPGSKCVLDLPTGEVLALPDGSPQVADTWLEQYDGYTLNMADQTACGVIFPHAAGRRVSDGAFDSMNASLAMAVLDRLGDGREDSIMDVTAHLPNEAVEMPATAILRTARGTSAIMQVARDPHDPKKLVVKYKLIWRQAAATGP